MDTVAQLQARLLTLRNRKYAWSSLEQLLTHPDYFGLETASPLQRAICRIADGRDLGELRDHPDIQAGIGPAPMGLARPHELDILSGIRAGKSLFAGALAVHWSQICDLRGIRSGETHPRIPIISLRLDLAKAVYDHVVGTLLAKPKLRHLLLAEPTGGDTILLRHPTGRAIEVRITAGARAGSSLVARWLAGCIFDEAPLMQGQDDAVINYDEAYRQVLGRILQGGQIVSIGSPWAPFGPIYERYVAGFGQPTAERVIIKAPGWAMNPSHWTPERCEALKSKDPDAYITTCAAEFMSPEESLLSSIEIDKATRPTPLELPYQERQEYVAAMDPATRGNAWTLVVTTRVGSRKFVVLARQWVGSRIEPLSPKAVLQEIARILRAYQIRLVYSDQWYGDALRDLARDEGLTILQAMHTEKEKVALWMSVRTKLSEGEIELAPESMLRNDLMRIKKRVTQSGAAIVLPTTSDGRHCDYAPALLLALHKWIGDIKPEPIAPGSDKALELEAQRMREAQNKKWGRKAKSVWR